MRQIMTVISIYHASGNTNNQGKKGKMFSLLHILTQSKLIMILTEFCRNIIYF